MAIPDKQTIYASVAFDKIKSFGNNINSSSYVYLFIQQIIIISCRNAESIIYWYYKWLNFYVNTEQLTCCNQKIKSLYNFQWDMSHLRHK